MGREAVDDIGRRQKVEVLVLVTGGNRDFTPVVENRVPLGENE